MREKKPDNKQLSVLSDEDRIYVLDVLKMANDVKEDSVRERLLLIVDRILSPSIRIDNV